MFEIRGGTRETYFFYNYHICIQTNRFVELDVVADFPSFLPQVLEASLLYHHVNSHGKKTGKKVFVFFLSPFCVLFFKSQGPQG